MDIYPQARRVLLTAYADTDVAIDAVNVVDLDHYLLKPWDPPEEKFYPVLDAQLEAWTAHPPKSVARDEGGRAPVVGAVVGGAGVPGAQPGAVPLVRAATARRAASLLDVAGADDTTLPVVVTTQGEVLVAPTDGELAEQVGLSVSPSERFYDLVVIGGGPAGLSAALYGASEGLRTALVERTATGGQAGQSSRIENYLGFPDGVSGAQLTERARRQALKFGAEIVMTRDAVGARGARRGAVGAVRRRQHGRRAHRDRGQRRRLPRARRTGDRRAHRARRLLRLRPHRGDRVRGPGHLRRRRRQLRRAGRDVPVPARARP